MQKIHKFIISLIVTCLITFVIPFYVSADLNYSSLTGCDFYNTLTNGRYNYFYSSSTVRYVMTYYNGTLRHTFVSDSPFTIVAGVSTTATACPWNNLNSGTQASLIEGTSYYYVTFANANVDSVISRYISDGVNIITDQTLPISYSYILPPPPNGSVSSLQDRNEAALYYTYGEGAEDTPSINYGDLVVGFHTNFSASGTTNNYTITNNTNLDTIEWENVDSNGNDLSNKGINVEIRAVPIFYSANSKSALDLLGFQDAVVDSNNGLILWQGNFNDNHKSFIWNDVIHQLQTSNPAFAITSILTGSVWTRYGWIYQIRYNDVLNSYSSNWQTIYNSTSIKVSDSEHIVNQYYYHYPSGVGSDDQDIFHDINTVNNTTNNWYVNDVPVDPDASWLDSLIQAIAEILGKILDFFSNIFDGLVDLLLGLFGNINPADSFFNWFSDLFNGIGDIDLTLPQFNLPSDDLSSFNRLVQETMDIFSLNNFGFVIFIPLLLIIIKAVF